MPRCRNWVWCPGALRRRPRVGVRGRVRRDEDGEQRLALTEAWSVPFEACLPVRGFPSYKGQRNHVGPLVDGDDGIACRATSRGWSGTG